MGELMTITEVAERLNLHRNSIARLIKAGKLETVIIIKGKRVTRDSVDRYLRKVE